VASNTAQTSIPVQELCLLWLLGRKDIAEQIPHSNDIFAMYTLISCCIFLKRKIRKVWRVACFMALEFIVIRMVELAHEAVDVGRCITPNVRNEESNELWRDIVKHWAMNIDLCQDLPCKVNSSNIRQTHTFNLLHNLLSP